MGQSTNAIIAYGVDLGEEIPKWLLEFGPKDAEEGDMYELEEILEEKYGMKLEIHCSDSCPMYVLAVAESVRTAYRGSPQKLGKGLKTAPEWAKTWEPFKKAGKPTWLLFSLWM